MGLLLLLVQGLAGELLLTSMTEVDEKQEIKLAYRHNLLEAVHTS